jgi:hypothetical protein
MNTIKNYSLLAINNHFNIQEVKFNEWLALILVSLIFLLLAKFDKSKDFWI